MATAGDTRERGEGKRDCRTQFVVTLGSISVSTSTDDGPSVPGEMGRPGATPDAAKAAWCGCAPGTKPPMLFAASQFWLGVPGMVSVEAGCDWVAYERSGVGIVPRSV